MLEILSFFLFLFVSLFAFNNSKIQKKAQVTFDVWCHIPYRAKLSFKHLWKKLGSFLPFQGSQ